MCQRGVKTSFHGVVPLWRHPPVTCKARVRQVKQWTYPSMVLCTLGNGVAATEITKVIPGRLPLPVTPARLLGTRS